MKYLIIVLLIIVSIYPMSFARYNWSKKNRWGAVGAALLAAASVIYPVVLVFTR
ncbi:MAG TPA: hypothetical protein VF941_24390 [Clostridia bacterium]